MQVDWSTFEAIAATKAIDLWILFPLGQAANRLPSRNDIPAGGQAQRGILLIQGCPSDR